MSFTHFLFELRGSVPYLCTGLNVLRISSSLCVVSHSNIKCTSSSQLVKDVLGNF